MEISTAILLAIVLLVGLWVPCTTSGTSVVGEHVDTPGSHGGSRGVTPTLARTLVGSDRLDPAQTMRGGLVSDRLGGLRHRA